MIEQARKLLLLVFAEGDPRGRPSWVSSSLNGALISALGALIGSYWIPTDVPIVYGSTKMVKRHVVDWLEVFSFAVYGGVVGPLAKRW